VLRAGRILETSLYAEDLQAAEAFYSRVLGLNPFAKEQGRHLFYRCGEAVFLIFNPEATTKEPGAVPRHGARGRGHIAFAVSDGELEGWRVQLGQQGVEIEAEVSWPKGGRSLYFRDPAGNSLELATPQTWGFS